MLKTCLGFWKSEPQYAYKRYAYKKNNMYYEISETFNDWMQRYGQKTSKMPPK